jgi:acyl-CoA synthetase (AMP-forming)/AMP-acid ligase II
VSLCVMPLFHIHGLVASTLATLATGGAVVLPSQFNALSFWQTARDHRATWYSAVPAIHQLLLKRAGAESRRRPAAHRLRFARSCSAPLAPVVMRELEQFLGAPVVEAYGMTEAAHQIASNSPYNVRKPGSVGPARHVRLAIADERGRQLPTGTSGEVVIQGPNVIRAYDGPHAPADAFVDGWFRTGDIGYLDEDDHVTLVGRIKELINRGGEKVAPREIEEVLLSHPGVTEAVCFGMPHEIWGEEIAAAVVLSGEVPERELLAFCRARVAEHTSPKEIFVVDSIPRSATGKVLRRDLARHFHGGRLDASTAARSDEGTTIGLVADDARR